MSRRAQPPTVFVGNLAYEVTEEQLHEAFQRVGPVLAVRCDAIPPSSSHENRCTRPSIRSTTPTRASDVPNRAAPRPSYSTWRWLGAWLAQGKGAWRGPLRTEGGALW